jgi:hypothetical protein
MRFLICLIGIISTVGCSDDTAPTGGAGTGGGGTGGENAGDCDGATCGAGEFCGFEANACDGPRTCQAIPECDAGVACGCDGENYPTACDAMAQSGGVSASGACTPPDGQFICNYEYQLPIYCELGTEYCKVEPTSSLYMLACEPQPEACDEIPTDCDCLADPCSENYCGIDESNGAVTVLCPLPE